MKLTNKVRSLRPEEFLAVQIYVNSEMGGFRKLGLTTKEAQRELKCFLKKIRKIKTALPFGENVIEKIIYAIYLVNIYPELKTIKFRPQGESEVERLRRLAG